MYNNAKNRGKQLKLKHVITEHAKHVKKQGITNKNNMQQKNM